jgi:hypothetical protein
VRLGGVAEGRRGLDVEVFDPAAGGQGRIGSGVVEEVEAGG